MDAHQVRVCGGRAGESKRTLWAGKGMSGLMGLEGPGEGHGSKSARRPRHRRSMSYRLRWSPASRAVVHRWIGGMSTQ